MSDEISEKIEKCPVCGATDHKRLSYMGAPVLVCPKAKDNEILGYSIRPESAFHMSDEISEKIERLKELVTRQAEDPGLWFDACTAAEAYLQQELRKLHAAIEID